MILKKNPKSNYVCVKLHSPLKSNDLFLPAFSDVTNQSHPPDTSNDSSDSDNIFSAKFKAQVRRVLTPGAKFSDDEGIYLILELVF